NPVGLAADQRGSPRVSGSAPDIGAFELTVTPTSPNVIQVTNLNDAGLGSLRQAVLQANVDATPDEIQVAGGLTGTITLRGGEIAITQPLVITGPGASALTVNGNNASRVFRVDDGANTSINVSISGLTLTNANAGAAQGGAVLDANENLTLSN